MKKNRRFLLLLSALSLLLLCSCGSGPADNRETGRVIAAEPINGGQGAELTFLDREDQQHFVRINEDTQLSSSLEQVDLDAVRSGEVSDIAVYFYYKEDPQSRSGDSGEDAIVYNATRLSVDAVLEKDVRTLSDGTSLDAWRSLGDTTFQRKDGTILLTETPPCNPFNISGGGAIPTDDLSDTAKEAIKDYYRAQGLLYDLDAELEKVLAYSLAHEETFLPTFISQDILPVSASDRVIYFVTKVTLPGTYVNRGAAFDRTTGAAIPMADCFAVPEEEAVDALLDAANTAPGDREAMKTAFSFDSLEFLPDRLEFSYPAGTIPGQSALAIYPADYQELKYVLQPWAIPVQD